MIAGTTVSDEYCDAVATATEPRSSASFSTGSTPRRSISEIV